ncbi:MAG TPA: site-specific integrase [Candidatus Eremiobacteraceae bacterium]|nr:site-specific integrase [Candidatus Eremiobacteraceae bacterium]
MTPLRKRMLEELQLRNLSEATSNTYVQAVARFAKHFGKSPEQLGPDYVRQYLLHLLNDKKDTWSTLQVNRGALKFLYARVLKQSWFDEEIAAPKRRPTLPTILSPEQITRILDRTNNLKHWTIIATFYATALRCTELRYLKVTDIDGQQMILHVRHGKGSVPRDIPLSPVLRERLRVYYRWRKPNDWLFPSKQHPDRPLDDNSLRALCSSAGHRAGIPHAVHPHLFRHACATHMLNAGADLRTIQVLLGHADIRTTAKYLRVSLQRLQAVHSPFDALSLQPIDGSQENGRQR